MARIRTVKPEFWTSEQVAMCSRDARLLFIGMWNFCDDGGVHPASLQRVKMEVFPGDDCGKEQISEWIEELKTNGLITEYEVDGDSRSYWRVTGWSHQRIDQPNYKYPSEDGEVPESRKRLAGKQRQLMIKRLKDRDGPGCQHCGTEKNLAIDHVYPVSKGGPDTFDNYQLLCRDCNNIKYNKVTQQVTTGDSPPDSNGMEGKGGDGKRKAQKRATELPDDFTPTDNNRKVAAEMEVSLPDELAKFKDHHTAKGSTYKDWNAALNTWLRNARDFKRGAAPVSQQRASGATLREVT